MKSENKSKSIWKLVGIGLGAIIIIMSIFFGYQYLTTDYDKLYAKYDKEMRLFTANENGTLEIYKELENRTQGELIASITDYALPKWNENIRIIDKTNKYNNLPWKLRKQNKKLLQYSKLRIEAFTLLRKSLEQDTYQYSGELDVLHTKINEIMEQIRK